MRKASRFIQMWGYFLLLAFHLAGANDLRTNLTERRSPSEKFWCAIRLNEDHHGWSANQPPEEWTRIVLFVGEAKHIQLTACDHNGNPGAGAAAYVEETRFFGDVLYFALEWWNSSWTCYANLKHCDYTLWLGVPPV